MKHSCKARAESPHALQESFKSPSRVLPSVATSLLTGWFALLIGFKSPPPTLQESAATCQESTLIVGARTVSTPPDGVATLATVAKADIAKVISAFAPGVKADIPQNRNFGDGREGGDYPSNIHLCARPKSGRPKEKHVCDGREGGYYLSSIHLCAHRERGFPLDCQLL